MYGLPSCCFACQGPLPEAERRSARFHSPSCAAWEATPTPSLRKSQSAADAAAREASSRFALQLILSALHCGVAGGLNFWPAFVLLCLLTAVPKGRMQEHLLCSVTVAVERLWRRCLPVASRSRLQLLTPLL